MINHSLILRRGSSSSSSSSSSNAALSSSLRTTTPTTTTSSSLNNSTTAETADQKLRKKKIQNTAASIISKKTMKTTTTTAETTNLSVVTTTATSCMVVPNNAAGSSSFGNSISKTKQQQMRPPPPIDLEPLVSSTSSGSSSNVGISPQPPVVRQQRLRRLWIPGYPGSGSELMRTIIPQLTGGFEAREVYEKGRCDTKRTITCKTHYPVVPVPKPSMKYASDTYFFLLRNPANAIPSYFNWLWETRHGIQSHTTQAPIDEWRIYRNENFIIQMDHWVNIIRYWDARGGNDDNDSSTSSSSSSSASNRSPLQPLYLPYEELVHEDTGIELIRQMAREIYNAQPRKMINITETTTRSTTISTGQSSSNSSSSSSKELDAIHLNETLIPCVWKTCVIDRPSQKRISRYIPSYTIQQKEYMLIMIKSVMTWSQLKQNSRLENILEIYYNNILHDLPIDIE